MTVVVIECNSVAFLTSFQEGLQQKWFFSRIFFQNASKLANCTIVDIVNYLMLLLVNY